jgi:hypothetical protein
MTTSRLAGISLLASGISFFAVLSYEPANIVTFFGLQGVVDEAAVVLVSLLAVVTFIAGGITTLRLKPPPTDDAPSL